MIFKADVLFSGLCVFLAIMIVVVIVSLLQSEKTEANFKEPVTIALVEDPRTFAQKQDEEQKETSAPIQVVAKKQTVDVVSIPTDHSIDTAIQVVTQTANVNYENFVNTVPPNTAPGAQAPRPTPAAGTPAAGTQAPRPAAAAAQAPKPTVPPVSKETILQNAQAAIDAKNKLDRAMSFVDPNASLQFGRDVAGEEIRCYYDGSGPDFCANLCHKDQNCRGYNYVKPQGGSGQWAKGGCCLKKKATPLRGDPKTNFYTVIPSSKSDATAAQIGAQADITMANIRSASGKAAIQAAMAATTPAERAAALAKAESGYAAIQKQISGYRGYKDATASKYANQVFNDPAATASATFATGKDTDMFGPQYCSEKCNADASCRGFQYISRQTDTSPSGSNFAGTGGCQYFKHSNIGAYTPPGITKPLQDIKRKADATGDAYVILPNPTGTIAQKGFVKDIQNVQGTINMYSGFNNYTSKMYTKAVNKDLGTNTPDPEIGNIVGGSPDQCRVKCDADPSCQGFNYVRNTVNGQPTGKCSYKRKSLPLVNTTGIDFFTKNPLPAPRPAAAPAVAPRPAAAPAAAPRPASPAAAPAASGSVARNAGTVGNR